MNQFGRNRDSGVYDSGLSSGEGDPKMSQNISRPSGKSIYQQRKQYSHAIASLHDSFQHRVEHVLTCEVDGKQMSTAEDAMERLKMMDSQGRVWGQDVILNVNDGELSLSDIETREELDCFNLHSVLSCSSILNSCSYNSVLALTIREVQARRTCIYLFQCEELRADVLHGNIEKAIERGRHGEEDVNNRNLRNNLENMLSQQVSSPRRRSSPSPRNTLIQLESPPPYQHPPSREHREEPPWNSRNAPVYDPPPQRQSWQEQGPVDPRPDRRSQEMDMQRDSEILNHVLGDIELFLMSLKETTGYSSINSTRKSKKKKNKKGPLPPDYEYNDVFQKIKYAFNLLGKIGPGIQEPSAPDLVHILFSSLSFIMANSPRKDMAPSVISPLLTQKAINLMNFCVTEQERNTWRSLGDAWMVTRADWPNGKKIPPYTPTFSDGWMPREPPQSQYNSLSSLPMERSSHPSSPRPSQKQTAPLLMRAMYDFIGRNSKELTIMKGDVLEVLDQSKKWWMVKNSSNERGYIPNNVLEPTDVKPATSNQDPKAQGPPVLNPRSSAGEVAAWLRTLGFSKLTVTCFGVLNGELLMELSRDEMKTVCPEEGGRVFNALHSPRPGR